MSRIGTTDFYLELAKGNIPGHSSMLKFGENPTVGTVLEHIWDGAVPYVPPTQARLHDISSDDADDDGNILVDATADSGSLTTLVDADGDFVVATVAVGDIVLNDDNVELGNITGVTATTLTMAGSMRNPNNGLIGTANGADAYRVVTPASTGCSFIHILGLDASFLEIEEFVVLDGLIANEVATTQSYIRQYRARAFGDGGSGGAEGTIISEAQVDGTVTCQIENGNNQTLMAIYTVPANKTGYIKKWWGTLSKGVGVSTTFADIHLVAGTLDGIGYVLQTRATLASATSVFNYDYPIPAAIPGGSDIWVEALASTGTVSISAGFDIVLVDN